MYCVSYSIVHREQNRFFLNYSFNTVHLECNTVFWFENLFSTYSVKICNSQKRRQRSSLLFGGAEFIQFLAALAVFHQDDIKKRMNSSYSSNRHIVKTAIVRQGIE